ncbi:MAG: hypothetical protein U9R02_09805 [Thermodesulfobacteriota bacterium]|nr:hypothetical protein [Thermodesulfobacteriota bacterium]
MPLSQFRNVVGSAVTAGVLCYSYLGAPTTINTTTVNPNIQISAPREMKHDYYRIIDRDEAIMLEQIDIIHKFASSILDNIKDLDPEFSKTVDENFWDLI